jgi:hypothetical protein
LNQHSHCRDALKFVSGIDKLDAILFALAMAKDGGTGRLARRILSIQM